MVERLLGRDEPAAASAGYGRGAEEPIEAYAARLQGLLLQRDLEIRELKGRLEGSTCAAAVDEDSAVADAAAEGAADGGDGLVEVEALLAGRSQAQQNPAVLQLLAGLQAAAVYTDTPNHETNRKLWDAYAKGWASEEGWVKRMASHLPGGPQELSCVGAEWSDEASLSAVLEDWLLSQVGPDTRAAEIGSGGGRIAERVAQHVKELVCFDISAEMLAAAKKHLQARGVTNARFQQVEGDADYPGEYSGRFDFAYAFDVLVHLDLHQMRRTLRSVRELLRPGGRCFLTFANLLAPDGWRRFARQRSFTVGGFYFISPEIARFLLQRVGLEVLRVSAPQAGNTYLNRDLLVLARRPEGGGGGAT